MARPRHGRCRISRPSGHPWTHVASVSAALLLGALGLALLGGGADGASARAGVPPGDGFEREQGRRSLHAVWHVVAGAPRITHRRAHHGRGSLLTPRSRAPQLVARRWSARRPATRLSLRFSWMRGRTGRHVLLQLRANRLRIADDGRGRLWLEHRGVRRLVARPGRPGAARPAGSWNRLTLQLDAPRGRVRLYLNGSRQAGWLRLPRLRPERRVELGARDARNGPVWFDSLNRGPNPRLSNRRPGSATRSPVVPPTTPHPREADPGRLTLSAPGDGDPLSEPFVVAVRSVPDGASWVQLLVNGTVRREGSAGAPVRWSAVPSQMVPGRYDVLVRALSPRGAVVAQAARSYVVRLGGLAAAVAGARLVDGRGAPLRLRGVSRGGTEWQCGTGLGTHEGPLDGAALDAIAAWGGNAVRIPLNAHCWLGSAGLSSADAGAPYRQMVRELVARLAARGQYAVLDLHWSAPAGERAGQRAMADADHAVDFWRSVARLLRDEPSVLFELYNEPHGIGWRCWREGCATGDGWRAAGMQEMLSAIRGEGARQPVIATGLRWGNDLTGWLAAQPHDPAGQLVAGFHVYSFNDCTDAACWEREVAPVARQVPVLISEFGSDDCRPEFARSVLDWADSRGVSYTGWAWYPGDCAGFPALISDWSGAPTPYGRALRDRLGS